MIELARIAANVATPIGLIGIILTLILYGYSKRLKHKEVILAQLPEDQRDKFVAEQLTRYNLNASNLTREQKFNLLIKEMDGRQIFILRIVYVLSAVFVSCFAMGVFAYIYTYVGLSVPRKEDKAHAQKENQDLSQKLSTNGENSPAVGLNGAIAGRDMIVNMGKEKTENSLNEPKPLNDLMLLLTDRASRAGTPIVNDHRYSTNEKVRDFKSKYVTLSLKLHDSMVSKDIYGANGIIKTGEALSSYMWVDGRRLNLGFAAFIFFEPLPSHLRSEILRTSPGIAPFLDLFKDIAEPEERELARLQGNWRITSAQYSGTKFKPGALSEGILSIVSSRWTIRGELGTTWDKSFRIYPKVGAIDFAGEDGESFKEGGNLWGYYSLNGDKLSIAAHGDSEINHMSFQKADR